MIPTLENIKERIKDKADAYFDEFAGVIRKHMQEGRDVTFRLSAKITDTEITYSSAVGVSGAKAEKTCDKLDDPNQPELPEAGQ